MDSFIPIHVSEKAQELLDQRQKHVIEAVESLVTKKTPQNAIYVREGRGGNYSYIQGAWLIEQLNLLFDYNWDWEVLYEDIRPKHVVVRGLLTVRSISEDGTIRTVKKSGYGGHDIAFKSGDTANPIDLGDNLKAASTDAFKKAASMLGIAADVYGSNDKKEVEAQSNKADEATLKGITFNVGKIGWTSDELNSWLIDENQKDVNPQSVSLDDLGKDESKKVLAKLVKVKQETEQNSKEKVTVS